MEAVGTLAGGIAHDFNNILGVIIGYTELVQRDLPNDPTTQMSLDQVLKASHRAKELVRQILRFSRHEEFQRSHLRLDAVLAETIALLRATLPASLEILPQVIPPVPPVSGNQTLIQQVLVNLATNAAQAIGRQPGQIGITIEGWRIDESSPELGGNLRPGQYARLTVRDTGPGIDSAIIDRIFEPFFTTKGPGAGTGLGLSVVHGIIQSHDGAIRVRSRPGFGSIFEVYLPATTEETPPPSPERLDGAPVRGSERILLVDDEASLLKIGERFLRQAGYEVTTCLHPDTALELFRHAPENFDLVITDYSMPGQSGLDLGARIREVRPDLPMLICTGYGAGLTKERARRVGFHDVLHKPVGLEEFGQAIREALESNGRMA
jgi:CheY-like chemotaxis protein